MEAPKGSALDGPSYRAAPIRLDDYDPTWPQPHDSDRYTRGKHDFVVAIQRRAGIC